MTAVVGLLRQSRAGGAALPYCQVLTNHSLTPADQPIKMPQTQFLTVQEHFVCNLQNDFGEKEDLFRAHFICLRLSKTSYN